MDVLYGWKLDQRSDKSRQCGCFLGWGEGGGICPLKTVDPLP